MNTKGELTKNRRVRPSKVFFEYLYEELRRGELLREDVDESTIRKALTPSSVNTKIFSGLSEEECSRYFNVREELEFPVTTYYDYFVEAVDKNLKDVLQPPKGSSVLFYAQARTAIERSFCVSLATGVLLGGNHSGALRIEALDAVQSIDRVLCESLKRRVKVRNDASKQFERYKKKAVKLWWARSVAAVMTIALCILVGFFWLFQPLVEIPALPFAVAGIVILLPLSILFFVLYHRARASALNLSKEHSFGWYGW